MYRFLETRRCAHQCIKNICYSSSSIDENSLCLYSQGTTRICRSRQNNLANNPSSRTIFIQELRCSQKRSFSNKASNVNIYSVLSRNQDGTNTTRFTIGNMLLSVKENLHQSTSFLQNRFYSSQPIDENFVQKTILKDKNKKRLINRLGKWNRRIDPFNPSKKKAAVLIPLCMVNNTLSFLYTRRTPHLRLNAGQPSFPGGMVDKKDSSIVAAALRECEEEIGITSRDIEVWASLHSFANRRSEIEVCPVLSFVKDFEEDKLHLNTTEVQSVFTVPITTLLQQERHGYTQFHNGWKLPVFKAVPTNVWGMTAMITDVVLANAFPNHYQLILRKPQHVGREEGK